MITTINTRYKTQLTINLYENLEIHLKSFVFLKTIIFFKSISIKYHFFSTKYYYRLN